MGSLLLLLQRAQSRNTTKLLEMYTVQSRKNRVLAYHLGSRQLGGFKKGLMIALTNSAVGAYFPGKESH